MIWLVFAAGCAAGYVLGSVPNGLLVARARGIDIRSKGSGNIGATNVFRTVGKLPGILVFLADMFKGLVPAALFPLLAETWLGVPATASMGLLFGAAAIFGHNWPIFLKFKGGKGIATSAGMLLGVAPLSMVLALAVWLALTFSTRYVSVGSIAAALTVAVSSWFFYHKVLVIPLALTMLAGLAIWKHRANIKRLLNGTESRFGKPKNMPHAEQPAQEQLP